MGCHAQNFENKKVRLVFKYSKHTQGRYSSLACKGLHFLQFIEQMKCQREISALGVHSLYYETQKNL